jgi:alpha-amylase
MVSTCLALALGAVVTPATGARGADDPSPSDVGCTTEPASENIGRVKVGQRRLTLRVGGSVKLEAIAYRNNGVKSRVAWFSSSKKVASVVTSTGVVKARKIGKATLQAYAGGQSAWVSVTVIKASQAKAVRTVTLKGVKRTMRVGEKAWVTGYFEPARATNVKIRFAAAPARVLTVDRAGRVIAHHRGTAHLSVTANCVSKRYTVKVA